MVLCNYYNVVLFDSLSYSVSMKIYNCPRNFLPAKVQNLHHEIYYVYGHAYTYVQ